MEHLPIEIIEQIALYANSANIFFTCSNMMKKITPAIINLRARKNQFLYNIPTPLMAVRCFLKRIKYKQYDGLKDFLHLHNDLIPGFYIIAIIFMKKKYKKLFKMLSLPGFTENSDWKILHKNAKRLMKKVDRSHKSGSKDSFFILLHEVCGDFLKNRLTAVFTEYACIEEKVSIDEAILYTQQCIDNTYNLQRERSPFLYKEIMTKYNDNEILYSFLMQISHSNLLREDSEVAKIYQVYKKGTNTLFTSSFFYEMFDVLAIMKKDDLMYDLLVQHSFEDGKFTHYEFSVSKSIILNHPQFVIKLIEYGNFNVLLKSFRTRYAMLPHNILERLSKTPSFKKASCISVKYGQKHLTYKALEDSVKRYGAQDLEDKLHLLIEDGAEKRAVNYLCKCPFNNRLSATVAACIFSLYIKRMDKNESTKSFFCIITKTLSVLMQYMCAELSNLSSYMIVFKKIVENVECDWANIIDFYEVIVELSGLMRREWSSHKWSEQELSEETIMEEYEIADSGRRKLLHTQNFPKYQHVIKALRDIDVAKAKEFEQVLSRKSAWE